jgi:hypothetical protein
MIEPAGLAPAGYTRYRSRSKPGTGRPAKAGGYHGSGVPGWLPGDDPLTGQPGDLGRHGPGVGTRERVGLTGRLWKPIVRVTKRPHRAVLRASGRRDVSDAG